jgi:hypothetical protein
MTNTLVRTRDPQWLADVRKPGPRELPSDHLLSLLSSGVILMQDDVDTGQFTGGMSAYAGYYNGSFANMTAVRRFASSQGARSFSYTPDGTPGADAIDIEPGDASPSDAPGFFRNGGRYFYSSASTTQQVIDALDNAGIGRASYKLISAHYIGLHQCGPGTCGFPQADATQFTDTYAGRSLDCTVCSSSFFGTPVPPQVPSHRTVGMYSLAKLSKALKTAPATMIRLTVENSNHGVYWAPAEAAYMNGVFARSAAKISAGQTWYLQSGSNVVTHKTVGQGTLASLAQDNHNTAAQMLRLTAEHSTGGKFSGDVYTYINAVVNADTVPIPAGQLWYY